MSKPKKPLILASQSPRRVELLKKIIKNFLVIPSGIDEVCSSKLSPEENAIILSRKKADWVANRYPHHWVIGADTLVVLKNEIIGNYWIPTPVGSPFHSLGSPWARRFYGAATPPPS